jgi:transcription antitermination factor NusG
MHSKLNESEGESESRPWYAVYTKHQHEKTACELLTGKGFEVFLPLYGAKRQWKDRTRVVSLPVFPGYLFLRTNLVRKLEILQTPGVFWLVESGSRTCEIPNSEIEAVRRITQSSATVEPHPYLKCGDQVCIRQGALAGIEGVLVRVKNRYRVVVSVNLLQKAIAVEVDFSMVERIGPGGETTSIVRQRNPGASLSACS